MGTREFQRCTSYKDIILEHAKEGMSLRKTFLSCLTFSSVELVNPLRIKEFTRHALRPGISGSILPNDQNVQ